ncbi:FAD:protein FMN transferase [Chloroflexota bacterium]
MKKACLIIVSVLVPLIAMLGATSCAAPLLRKFEDTRSMMDTFVTITVYATDEEKAEAAINSAFVRMEEIEGVASIFDEQAQASQLNRDGYLEAPSEDLRQLITKSLEYSELTGGAFDITVQPLLELWETGLWQEPEAVQQQRINETLALVGWDKISTQDDKIFFTKAGMKITLGGIAKGYAIDEALKVIKKMGINHALVNAGGDMATLGSKLEGEPWLIALVNPDDQTQSLVNFNIAGEAVATSGNYARYFDPEKKAHHIINPKTGYSAQECISATVIAKNATQADTLATSIFVIGPEEGVALIESLSNVECLIVSADRETIYASSGLSMYLAESEPGE